MKLHKTVLKVIQVAKTKLINKETGKKFFCKYSDVPSDENGWVDCSKYLPISFDMMYLSMKNRPSIINGWWDGKKWVSIKIKPNDKVILWKRHLYDY